jgi:hypothetical protein
VAVCTYNRGADRILELAITGTLDLRCILITGNATGVIDQDLDTVAAIDALNSGATNIHTERITLAGEASAEDDTNNRANFSVTFPIVFAAAPGVTAVAAVVYDEGGGTDATRHLIAGSTTGFPQPVDGGLNLTGTDLFRLLTATA